MTQPKNEIPTQEDTHFINLVDKLDIRAIVFFFFVIGIMFCAYGRFERSFDTSNIELSDQRCENMIAPMGEQIDQEGNPIFASGQTYNWDRTRITCKQFVQKPATEDGLDFTIIGCTFLLISGILYGFYFGSKKNKK